ncbi:diaminopimelate epimerase [Opitutus terrae]|uniref:Diaminopimelate epimerase n=1 Tax=Opitutus terrae (strain DSM 11246 / JCM 15787 / PB90-1) TaxID=452637 RepID=B1ZZ82_OPITP|nr:diaminopimelate epimerase [Opitutus terrae]ACB77154.1 Diaminopimelate epimerase [Opitutus terrae PB90-1]
MRYHKYHALGNDYIVLDPRDFPSWQPAPTIDQIRVVCHRNFGVGSDGILWGPLPSKQSEFGLRIFNPDGSEAEKSGNGLRIFSRFLWDQKLVRAPAFTVETPGGNVESVIKENGRLITVAMGRVSFDSAKIPVNLAGAAREVINEKLTVLDREFTYCAATIGNPHCVIPLAEISPEIAHRYGPAIETHPNFPRKTNVQFLRVRDRQNIQLEIWERGAGYTLASGSSSSAAAAVAHRLGLVDRNVTVHMPGGTIGIEIGGDFSIMMTGTVNKVAEGTMHPELFAVKV